MRSAKALAEPVAGALCSAVDAHMLVHVTTHELDIADLGLICRVLALDPEKHLEPGAGCQKVDQQVVDRAAAEGAVCCVDPFDLNDNYKIVYSFKSLLHFVAAFVIRSSCGHQSII